jgi:HD superfamily phosphodiesterase
VELSVWAEEHAGQLLSSLRRRWSHATAVGTAAREVGRHLTSEDAEVLLAAAYLHDIGYAPDLVETGFHQLDGAQHLSTLGHDRLAGLVAHHTRAVHEARLRGLGQALSEFEDEDSIVSAALAFCDLTAGPSGEQMTPEQRLADVEARYGEDDPVTMGLRAAWPELLDDVAKVHALLKQRPVVAQPR